jgi:hypothetical protein
VQAPEQKHTAYRGTFAFRYGGEPAEPINWLCSMYGATVSWSDPSARPKTDLATDPQAFGNQVKRLQELCADAQPQAHLSATLAFQPNLHSPAAIVLGVHAEEADKRALVLETLGLDYESRERGQEEIRSAMAWPITLPLALVQLALLVANLVVPAQV